MVVQWHVVQRSQCLSLLHGCVIIVGHVYGVVDVVSRRKTGDNEDLLSHVVLALRYVRVLDNDGGYPASHEFPLYGRSTKFLSGTLYSAASISPCCTASLMSSVTLTVLPIENSDVVSPVTYSSS